MLKKLLWHYVPIWFAKLRNYDTQRFADILQKMYKADDYLKHTIIDVKEIRVKKGKRKYTVMVVRTPSGEIKCNIGRHKEEVSEKVA